MQIDLRGARHLHDAGGRPGSVRQPIRVRSILGRRTSSTAGIYRFGHGQFALTANRTHRCNLIGSADLMPRNLDRRVEVLVPIDHPKHRERLDQVLAFDLGDDVVRRELRSDDSWKRG